MLRIKRAYRKKALELHPDRNYGNVEETTKLFAEAQSAYEILSDPQERAWYDSHREAILQGEDDGEGENYEHSVRVTTANDIMKMFSRFRGRVEFSDSDGGFYGGLRSIFDMLAREEELACQWEGQDSIKYPPFGYAEDKYEVVVRPFYSAWNSFATKKTFSWVDIYRYSEAPDRRVRRLMEKENKRLRDEAIHEFNDAVRSLVAFVKKRDPRFKPSVQTEAERQKTLRDAASAQAARQRAANRAKQSQQGVIQEWMKSSEVPDAEITDDDDEEAVREHFECVVCNKSFKSEKQYEAHEKSKKHVKAVQQLQRQMQKEDMVIGSAAAQNARPSVNANRELDTSEDVNGFESASHNKQTQDKESDARSAQESTIGISEHDHFNEPHEGSERPQDDENMDLSTRQSSISSSNCDYTSREKVEERISGQKIQDPPKRTPTSAEIDHLAKNLVSESLNNGSQSNNPSTKLGKAKEKRAKKAAQKQSAGAGPDTAFKCAACQDSFPSRAKLFNHIKDLDHAQPVTKPIRSGRGKKK